MEITWITGGGFIIEQAGHRLVVDPYLSDVVEKAMKWTRLASAPVELEDLRPDIVFSSHNHPNHLDPEAIPKIAKYYPSCHFVGPKSVTEEITGIGINSNRLTTLKVGTSINIDGFQLTATPADHSDPDAVGIIIESDSKKIFISGDTRYYPELAKDILNYCDGKIDLALICMNGKYNNLNIEEAVDVLKELKPRIASPMHYGLFAENTEDPEPFIRKCQKSGINAYLFTIGKPVELDKLLIFYRKNNS